MANRPTKHRGALVAFAAAFAVLLFFPGTETAAAAPVPGVPLAPATDPAYAESMRITRTTTVTRQGSWPRGINGRVPCFPRLRWLISPRYRQTVRCR